MNESPKERVRVNRDDIRHMLGPYWVPTREDLVTHIEHQTILSAIHRNYSVVVDATNFNPDRLIRYIKDCLLINNKVGDITIKDFTGVPLETCIERDRKRGLGMVGEKVIRDMYNKYLCKETHNSHTG